MIPGEKKVIEYLTDAVVEKRTFEDSLRVRSLTDAFE
jgi:hypothetical protein